MKPQYFNNFESPRSKVERAKRKSTELKNIIGEYLARKPHRVGTKLNQIGHFYEFGVQRTIPIPDELIETLNDVVHVLRGALDNLAVDLVLYEGGSTKNLSYPIADTEIRFNKILNTGKINQVSRSAIDELRKFETYQGGKGEIIHAIHHLDIGDKHYWDAKIWTKIHIADLHLVYPDGHFNRIKSVNIVLDEKTNVISEIPILTNFKRNKAFVTGIHLDEGGGFRTVPLAENIDCLLYTSPSPRD